MLNCVKQKININYIEMFISKKLRYPSIIISIFFLILFVLTYSLETIKKYTIDMAFIHLIAHLTSWIVLFALYIIMMKWKKLI